MIKYLEREIKTSPQNFQILSTTKTPPSQLYSNKTLSKRFYFLLFPTIFSGTYRQQYSIGLPIEGENESQNLK